MSRNKHQHAVLILYSSHPEGNILKDPCFFFFFVSIAGGWKYNWKGMLLLVDHTCLYTLKNIYSTKPCFFLFFRILIVVFFPERGNSKKDARRGGSQY